MSRIDEIRELVDSHIADETMMVRTDDLTFLLWELRRKTDALENLRTMIVNDRPNHSLMARILASL